MITKQNLTLAGMVVAVIVSFFALLKVPQISDKTSQFGAVGVAGNMLAENYIPYLQSNGGYRSDLDMLVGGYFGLGATSGGATTTALQLKVTQGTCLNSAATSTIFSIANPFISTSTVFAFELSGTMGATTSDIIVSTSTASAPLGSVISTTTGTGVTQFWPNFLAVINIATSTAFQFTAGATKGVQYNTAYLVPTSGSPFSVPGSSGTSTISVAPGQFLVGMSTSTYGNDADGGRNGATGSGLTAIPSTCTYKVLWMSQ